MVTLVAGCSGTAGEEPPPAQNLDPVTATRDWLDAVATGDVARIGELVEPTGLVVVAAVENNVSSDQLVTMLEMGLSDQLATEYWTRFRDEFNRFQGSPIGSLTVGDEEPVSQPDGFTSVILSSESSSGRVILRNTDAGWQVDFAATVGPALIGPLGEYLESAVAGDNVAAISIAYRDWVVPALEAALATSPDNSALEFETEYIRQLAASG